MEIISQLNVGSAVVFPEWLGERHYMLPFTVRNGLPESIGRFETTVAQMLEGLTVDPDQECYIMVDEKEIHPGNFHRRPGLHVDGYWDPGTRGHGGHRASCHGPNPSPGHAPAPKPGHRGPSPGHTGISSHRAYWSPVAPEPKKEIPNTPAHAPRHRGGGNSHASEALLLASNYSAARAVTGQYNRDFINDWRGGDCSGLSTYGLEEVLLQANRAYHMDVMTLHESLPITKAVKRTLVRINVPGVVLS